MPDRKPLAVSMAVLSVAVIALSAAPLDQAAPASAAQPAASWTRFRGPQGDGISPETGLLASWAKGGPREVLTARGLGTGFSSVSIADGRIFTMGDRRDGQYMLALDQATGKEIWSRRIGGRHVDEYAGPRATPTIDGALIYTMNTDGDLVALEAATGRERWRKSLPDAYGAPTPNWMFSESPLVDGDRVLVTPGSRAAAMVAFDKLTGKEIWRASMPNVGSSGIDGPEYSSIVISNGGGVKQYVRLLGRGVISVRASDGRYLWGFNRVANGTANIPTPIVTGNLVFASTGYQTGAALLELVPQANQQVSVQQKYFLDARVFQNHHGGMVLIGGYVYAGKGHRMGIPICLELTTGRVVWGGDIRNAGEGSAAVLAADGHLYFRYENGVMMLIEATPQGYREKGQFAIPNVREPSWSHPVVLSGRMYLREQDTLHVYDIQRR